MTWQFKDCEFDTKRDRDMFAKGWFAALAECEKLAKKKDEP